VFGFGIGVFIGHMILNVLLYISPKKTIAAVKNPIISFAGSIAFMGLAVWGLIEAVKLLTGHHG
jgi:putative Ca2+/H+ antiporter (TMEM165/GDT1 family)